MEFDKNKVYTVLNADELKIGSKVICGFTISHLKERVNENEGELIAEVDDILDENFDKRIHVYFNGGWSAYPLAYLVSEPEKKKLKWTDLKVGDVIQDKKHTYSKMVIGIDHREEVISHIYDGMCWLDDDDLEDWEKVE